MILYSLKDFGVLDSPKLPKIIFLFSYFLFSFKSIVSISMASHVFVTILILSQLFLQGQSY